MKKLIGLAAFGLGYVLGARAGRERYEQIMHGFQRVRTDPRVREQAQHVAEMVKERAPAVVDKVTEVASSAVEKVRPSAAESADPDAESPDPDVAAALIDESAEPTLGTSGGQ